MHVCREDIHMEKIVESVVKRAGVTEEQAQAAVEAVLDYVRHILPEPLATQFSSALIQFSRVTRPTERAESPVEGSLPGFGTGLDRFQ